MVVVVTLQRFVVFKRPEAPEACIEGNRALEAQDYNGAIDNFLLCLESDELTDKAVAQVFFGLGLAYTAKGDHYQAIKDYGEAIRLNPDHAWAYNNRCWSYAVLRRGEEALKDCEEAVRLMPDQAEILDSRALAYWLLDEKDKARQDLERARKLNPAVPVWEERFEEFEAMF